MVAPEPAKAELFEHILLPIDGSEGAKRGAEYGLNIADTYGATVHVLFVVDERVHGQTPALSTEELAFEQWEEEGEAAIQEVVEQADVWGVDTVTSCVRGIPFQAILDYAQAHGIDLIVMGIHGHSALKRPHIGSTTDRVIRESEIPVLPV